MMRNELTTTHSLNVIRTKENPVSPKEVAIMLVLLCILIFPFAVLAELMKMNGK